MDSSDSSDSESNLDVYSPKFDPTKAFKSGKEMIDRLPFPRTRRLDNLNQYRAVSEASDDPTDFETNMRNAIQKRPLVGKKHQPNTQQAPQTRQFQPHQMPIQKVRIRRTKNLIDRMQNIKGPLAKLREYQENRIRVCIKTKNVFGGLNELLCFIAAFDKHWNLALEDVNEIFTRKIKQKTPANLGNSQIHLSDEQLAERGLVRPIVIEKMNKKLEKCSRHLPQIMLRGEYVVLVTPAV